MSELKEKALSGLVWTFTQQFGFQFVNFIVSVILARILMPEVFGIIGMIGVFIALGKSLVDSGMSSSLIRAENPNQNDYSTVFFANLLISFFVYVIIFFLAPFIATFFGYPILVGLLRLYCIVFIIGAFSVVQSTKLNKEMRFKTQFLINVPSLIFGSILGIVLANLGYGVWSLVWMNLGQTLLATIQLWLFSKWKPVLFFDKTSFKKHFGFGLRLTFSGMLNTLVSNLHSIVIGKVFTPAQLGFFTRANSMQELPFVNISNVLNKVSLPLFASINNEGQKLKSVYVQFFELVFFVIAPIMVLCIIIAEPLFSVLLTDKWLPAVPYFQVLCVGGLMMPLNSYSLNLLLIKGESAQYLHLNILKNIFVVLSIGLLFPFGIYGLLWGTVLTAFITFFINAYYSGKLIGFSVREQLKSIYPIVLISFFSGGIVYLFNCNFGEHIKYEIFKLFFFTLIHLMIVLGLSWLFKINSFRYLKNLYQQRRTK